MSLQNVTRMAVVRSPRSALESPRQQNIGRNPGGPSGRRQSSNRNNNGSNRPARILTTTTTTTTTTARSFRLTSSLALGFFLVACLVVGAAAEPDAGTVDLAIDQRGLAHGTLWERSAFAQKDDDATSSTSASAKATSTSSSSSSSATSTGSIATDNDDDGPVQTPKPFDGAALSTNLTADCTSFLKTFLAEDNFNDCLPLSFLLENSETFFQTLKTGSLATTKVVDQTCNVDIDTCTTTLTQYAADLTSPNHCQPDFDAGNPLVRQAANAFASYKTIFSAGCLKSAQGNYCYVEATSSKEFPSDPLIYFLPLGTQLPADTKLSDGYSCSQCMKDTLEIYATTTNNASTPLAETYSKAAAKINGLCGADFAKANLLLHDENASSHLFAGSLSVITAAVLAALLVV